MRWFSKYLLLVVTSVTTYPDNVVNQYTSMSGQAVAPAYDPKGNLTRSEQDYEFAYDFENRLTQVRDPADAVLADYVFDALGQRIEESKSGAVTRYYYDDESVLAEYDGAGALRRSFVHGPLYLDEHVLLRTAGGADHYYLLEGLYTVAGLASPQGHEEERYVYDPYGRATQVKVWTGDLNYDASVNSTDRSLVVSAWTEGILGWLCFLMFNRRGDRIPGPPARSCAHFLR